VKNSPNHLIMKYYKKNITIINNNPSEIKEEFHGVKETKMLKSMINLPKILGSRLDGTYFSGTKKVSLFIVLILLPVLAYAQYSGGSYDGYAMGEVEGSTLPVVLSSFTAQYLDGQAILYWQTQTETDNLGWNVYRNSESDFTSAIRINDEFILGHGTTAQPQDYVYEDTNGQFGSGDDYWYWLESIDYSGKVHHYDRVAIMHISEGQDPEPPVVVPPKYGLQTGPNPFSSDLTVSYMLPQTDMVRVEIYNIYGQLLTEFDEGQRTADINYKLKWNGKDLYGQDVASGVVLIKLITTDGFKTKKAILLR